MCETKLNQSKNKPFLAEATLESLKEYLKEVGEAAFRAKQIIDWVFKKDIINPDEMSNLSSSLKEKLKQDFFAPGSKINNAVSSPDGTTKFTFTLFDGEIIESVLIPTQDRLTLCLSTQVGCPVGCRFCASGEHGLVRNLHCGEILEQLLLTSKYAGIRCDHLVFMGIGEGLLNFEELSKALFKLTSSDYFGLSPRRITVSTSGFVPGMKKFAQLKKEYNLAISLHAPNDEIRSQLIPDKIRYPIKDILACADECRDSNGRQYTLEYTLIAGINDSLKNAEDLAFLAKEHRAKINLIPYNSTGKTYKRPTKEVIEKFVEKVINCQARITVRAERGNKKSAACGQLRSQMIASANKGITTILIALTSLLLFTGCQQIFDPYGDPNAKRVAPRRRSFLEEPTRKVSSKQRSPLEDMFEIKPTKSDAPILSGTVTKGELSVIEQIQKEHDDFRTSSKATHKRFDKENEERSTWVFGKGILNTQSK